MAYEEELGVAHAEHERLPLLQGYGDVLVADKHFNGEVGHWDTV